LILDRFGGRAAHLVAQDGAVAAGDADQFGNAPDHVVLELVIAAIGKDHAPHHADDLDAVVHVQPGQAAGKLIEIHRLGIAPCRVADQLFHRRLLQVVMVHQRAANGIALAVLHHPVHGGQVHEQGGDGQFGIGKIGGRLGLAEQAGQGFEHIGLPWE